MAFNPISIVHNTFVIPYEVIGYTIVIRNGKKTVFPFLVTIVIPRKTFLLL